MTDKFSPSSGYFHTPMSSYGSFRSYKTAPSSINDESACYSSGLPRGSFLTSMTEDDLEPSGKEVASPLDHRRGRPLPGDKSKSDLPKRTTLLQLSYLENKRAEARKAQQQIDSEYATLLKEKSLIPDPAVELNWSGRGQHVEFERSDEVPLEYIAPIGVSMNAKVDKVKCRRIMLARKIMKCDKRWSLSDAFVEVEHLHRLRHAHIVQLVGTYLQHRDFAILLYPAADWDLSAFMKLSNSYLPSSLLESICLELLPNYLTSFFPCLASALDYLHYSTTRHCDIKPSNILVKYIPGALEAERGHSAMEGEGAYKCAVCGKRYKNFNWLWYHRNYLSACNPKKQPAPDKLNSEVKDDDSVLLYSSFRVYLADFGISQTFVSQDQSQTDSYTGRTPKYCAPEVYKNLPYGRKADVFSLGCVFAEMYTVIAGRELDDFEDFRAGHGLNAYFYANIPEVHSWLALQIPEVEHLVLSNKIQVTVGNGPNGTPIWHDIYSFPALLEFMLEANPNVRPTAREVFLAVGGKSCCITGPESYVAAKFDGSKAI